MFAASDEELRNPKYLMKTAGNRKITDDHIWWSVFTRPIRSRFTRAQRVSICMAMIMLSMLANAMFYKIEPAREIDSYFRFGILSFDPYDVSLSKILMVF